jgi:hypothetical protein
MGLKERQHAPVSPLLPFSSRLEEIEIHENDRIREYRTDKPEAKNIKHVMLGSAWPRIVPRNCDRHIKCERPVIPYPARVMSAHRSFPPHFKHCWKDHIDVGFIPSGDDSTGRGLPTEP